ncbi:MAG: hypothetical protein KGH69_04900 [Candidatus Micrarchaeota archaeon]|nr:hypothetical protein [Candidatus Micrarchaeota archaeon]
MPRIRELYPLAGVNSPRIVESFTSLFRNMHPDASSSFIRRSVGNRLSTIFTLQYVRRFSVLYPDDNRVFQSAELLAEVNVSMLLGLVSEQDFRRWEAAERRILDELKPSSQADGSPVARPFIVRLTTLALADYARKSRVEAIGVLEQLARRLGSGDAVSALDYLHNEGDDTVRAAAAVALRRIAD